VVIRLSGEVVKRKKKLSKKYYGTSHILSKDEAEFVFEGDASSSFSVRARWAMCIYRRKLRLISRKRAARLQPTPASIGVFNRSHAKKKIGLFHVTC
jgi:hypothetical protein